MNNGLGEKKSNFVTRGRVGDVRSSTMYDAIGIIEYVKKLNPNARLIPNSRTYNLAVSQYNMNVVNTMNRPPVPEWFCGSVDPESGILVDFDADSSIGSETEIVSVVSSSAALLSSKQYPWDDCVVVTNSTPGSPAYVKCEDGVPHDLDMGSLVFWADFAVSYADGVESSMYSSEGSGSEGSGCNKSAKGVVSNGVEWCYGGWTPKNLKTGKFTFSIKSGNVNGISSSNGGDWGPANGGNPAFLFCMFLKQGSGYRGGKVDWISKSRTTRDLKNIHEGYGGWCTDGLASGSSFQACVVNPSTGEWSGLSIGVFR